VTTCVSVYPSCVCHAEALQWNAENFSFYSNHNRDKLLAAATAEKAKEDLDAGARLLNVIVVSRSLPLLNVLRAFQRPYAVATAGTPISTSYDSTTSVFTHRFRSPTQLIDTAPSLPEVTEIFLPKRLYRERDFDWIASSGGRVIFDWERERVFVWFIDVQRPDERPRPDRVRRFDVWVPSKVKPKQLSKPLRGSLLIFGTLLALYIAWRLQAYQWEHDRQAGINSGWANLRSW